MYLQLTQRCNMKCAHCAFSCTSKGKDMPRRIWKQAILTANNYGETIALGGGEPTLHKEFWEILGLAIGSCDEGYVWLATNGSQTDTSIALAKLAKKGVIGCALSLDRWHDPVDESVVEAFTKDKRTHSGFDNSTPDAREIRNTVNPFKAGRCKYGADKCVCPDLFVDVNGKVKGCGCKNAKVYGTIFDFTLPDDHRFGECSLKKD